MVPARPEVVVLGTVGVRCGGTLHRPSSGLSRALLALLAEAGSPGVAEARLEDVVWGERISRSTVTVAMHRLRRWLRTATGDALDIRRTSVGYGLVPDDVVTDVARFRVLVRAAESLAPRERARALGEALSLWQGLALADVPADRADPAVLARLAREQLAATFARGEALLASGEPAAAARVLEALAERHPYDEPVHAALVDALVQAGRRTEAITAFHTVRVRLREEFGVDPGRELEGALARTLRSDEHPSRPVSPAELPLDVAGFTGRGHELAALTAAARDHRAVVVVGMGGVGKTHLALHWAHRAAARFPDGQLYADLRGYAEEAPTEPAEVLRRFLRALGTPDDRIPAGADAAAALYRSLLHTRRVLVVLDNAADAHQVRPLLPGAPGCRTIVTGRGGLDGLAAVDGAARVRLDVLAEADAVRLLRGSLGVRADAEPAAVRALAGACGFLPLALRVAALRFSTSGTPSLATYTRRLRQNGSLAELVIDGDPRANVGACLAYSYRRLPRRTQEVLRLLGTVPGAELTAEKAAALAGTTHAVAQQEIDRLVAAQLLTPRIAGRYTVPELVREYARAAVSDRRAAVG
ncbi:BTAD domain-containing putative transcriptional regulator [Actinophytocola sp.]|uniref:AfsR/SARP family transcriptional regulator n=1 Tax=Actinophytocola sp. TaxID=1872138 RepID=UPI003899C98A